MNIITDAPVVVNGEINKTAFSNLKKADFSETGDYTFLKNEFKEGFYSMDGDSYYFNEEHNCFYGDDSEYFSGKETLKKVGRGIGKGAKAIGKGAVKTGKAVGKAGKFIAVSLKKFIGKLKPKKNAKPVSRMKSSTPNIEGAKVSKDKKIDTKGSNEKYIQVLEPLKSTSQGLIKQNDDGTTTAVPPSQAKTGPDGKQYEASDLSSQGETKLIKNDVTGLLQAVKVLTASEITPLTTEDGEVYNFKKEDVVDKETGKPPFLSKNVKIGLIIGGSVLTLGILGYFIFRKK